MFLPFVNELDVNDQDPFTALLDSGTNLDTDSEFVTRIKTSDVSRIIRCRIRRADLAYKIYIPSDVSPNTPTLYLSPPMMKAIGVSLGSKVQYLLFTFCCNLTTNTYMNEEIILVNAVSLESVLANRSR